MRHGEAAIDAPSDAVRPLTVCGHDESVQMATWLRAQSYVIDRVLVSPYLRAQQTLSALREVLALPEQAVTLPELTPGGDAAMVGGYLETLAGEGVNTVLVVSHLPLVGYLVTELCPQECPPMFATSAVAEVTLDGQGNGVFEWQVSPAHLLTKA